ncbi:MAG: RNase J family beta-CASP ribonuclease [Candidatus Woesearchaeota archaeon]|jgi:ribonuclease J|nr:RNase J family beta-CASP ribonuclease [Candidatus Woesearchaeota archaeon]|tara:strand:- start:16815 stop:18143 length:1329 start_codon:yes stop_codon:yes gene_type:complete
MIEIYAVGGYNEVGKNCTAINVDGDVVIIDLGIHLENYIKLTEDEDLVKIDAKKLMDAGAVPDISVLDNINNKAKAIVISHAHLDHVGAVPYIADKFNAPIICAPYTAGIIRRILKDDKIRLKNEIKTLNLNSYYKTSDNIKIEFIHITHSVPQTALVAVHTKYGIILYSNDFKLDLHPTLGKKPNFKRLEEIGKEGVMALIVESTYASDARKMPSESVAKEMLKDVLLGTDNKDNLIIVTTFSSHMARLKSIVEFGKKLNRKILFLGRSLAKYVRAAEEAGIINFSKDIEIVKYSRQIERRLKNVDKERKKYLLVVTGHQGEPGSVLCKIAKREFKFNLYPEDNVVFSCRTIPTPTNIANRDSLENELKQTGVRIFKDIHQSGHAAKEDLRDFINILKPKNIIPAHGTKEMKDALAELCIEMRYEIDKNIFLIRDGEKISL